MTTYKRPESVLVIVYDEHEQILALRRKDDAKFWQSVTGALEDGEVPMQAALREVEEEIGIDVVASGYQMFDARLTCQYEIRPEWRHRYPPDEFVNTEYTFLLQISSADRIVLTEHDEFSWISPRTAFEKFWSPSNCKAIQSFFLQENASQAKR